MRLKATLLLLFPLLGSALGFELNSKLMSSVWECSPTEIVIVSDAHYSKRAAAASKSLQTTGIPMILFNMEKLLEDVSDTSDQNCPIMVPFGDKKRSSIAHQLMRHEISLKESKSKKSIFLMIEDASLEASLQLLNNSVVNCPQSVDVGIFFGHANLFMMMDSMSSIARVMETHPINRHPSLHLIWTQEANLYCLMPCNVDFFDDRLGFVSTLKSPQLTSSLTSSLATPKHFFDDKLSVWGVTFGLPMGEVEDRSAIHSYEYKLLSIIEKALKFNSVLYNHLGYSGLDDQGRYVDVFGIIARMEADLTIGVASISFESSKISLLSDRLSDMPAYLTFVAPLGKPSPKYMALFWPFTQATWMCMAIALVVFPPIMAVLVVIKARMEKEKKYSLPAQVTGQSIWLCVGILCGESLNHFGTRHTNAHYFRFVLMAWMLMSFITLTAYSGNLFNFLSNPGKQEPINSVQGVLDSGLRIDWIIYGFGTEKVLEDPTITKKDIVAMWKAKNARPAATTSPTKLLVDVYEGESVAVMINMFLRQELAASFSTPFGLPLIHWPKVKLLYNDYLAYGMPKISPYWAGIKDTLLRLVDVGVVSEEEQRFFLRRRQSPDTLSMAIPQQRQPGEEFTLDDLQALFYCAVAFVFASMAMFGFELISGLISKADRE